MINNVNLANSTPAVFVNLCRLSFPGARRWPPARRSTCREPPCPSTTGAGCSRPSSCRARSIDLEETRLVPERRVLYQFSARGHDVTQALLGLHLTGARDAVAPYYRSRPLALALGLGVDEALASTMMQPQGHVRRPRHRRRAQSAEPRRRHACCRPAAASARSTRRRPAGRSRSSTGRACWRIAAPKAASRSRTAAMHRSRPTVSGPRSTSRRPNGCRSSISSRTTATAFRCRAPSRRRAATSPRTSRPSATCRSSPATAPSRTRPPA